MIHERSVHDSRRYHRYRPPTFTRSIGAGASESGITTFNPFGSQPFRTSQALGNQFVNPTANYLGFGGGASPYGRGEGPYGTYLNQAPAPLASYLPSMTNLSSQLTSGANQAYGGYQNAIDAFMTKLPGFESSLASARTGSEDALNYARTAASDAFSPLQSRASYQEASRRALAPAREGAAARGMLEGGQAQAGEQSLLSDLAFNTLQSDRAAQQQAIQGLTGAAGSAADITGMGANVASLGPQMQAALFSAYPQLAQLLTGAGQLPMQAVGQLLSYFQQAQNPAMSLLSLIKPQMGQTSHSWNFNI